MKLNLKMGKAYQKVVEGDKGKKKKVIDMHTC